MSLDSGPSAALISRKHDIAETVLSRKRKLCELYAVTTSSDPIPPYHDFLRDLAPLPPQPLAIFLGQNDLEKGRYFRVSSLPSRPQPSAFSPRSLRSSHTVSPARQPLAEVQPEPSPRRRRDRSRTSDGESPSQNHVEPSNQPNHLNKRDENEDGSVESNQDSVSRANRERVKSQASLGAPVESRELRRSKPPTPLPISEVQPDRTPSRLALDKQSRPESPPYSPGSEAIAAGTSLVDEASLKKARDGSANVLTPSKDEHDDVSPSQERTHVKDNPQGSADIRPGQHVPARHTSSVADAGDSVSSPSSATGRHSANSPRSEPRSPFTSPDEDTAHTHQAPTPAQQVTADESEATGRGSQPSPKAANESPDVTPSVNKSSIVSSPKPRTSDPARQDSQSADNVVQRDRHRSPSESIKANEQKRDTTDKDPTVRAAASQGQDSLEQTNVDDAEPMDVDDPEQPSHQRLEASPRTTKSSTADKLRIVKPRNHQHKIIKVGKSKQLALCGTPWDRERPQSSKTKSNKQDYFRPQVVRDVLNAVFRQDLNTLLTNCNVTLTTADWMLHNEEEHYRILLQRTLHLQNTQRWSLKQLAPFEAPGPEFSHWDYVLQEAKWLRTDFREERKQKVSVARQLASWCAEWVNASADERIRLQKPASIPLRLTEQSQTAQVHSTPKVETSSSSAQPEDDLVSFAGDEELVFASPGNVLPTGTKARISRKVLARIPQFNPINSSDSSLAAQKQITSPARVSRDHPSGGNIGAVRGSSSDKIKVKKSNIPPEDSDCALFLPEYKQMRNRLNAVWIYKPPQLPMPSQGFYEHRTPSQWTWEDDQQLRQNVKDYGVNWHLISQNMTPKQEFFTTSDRRTPWECYERLLILDPPQHDMQARQYLKHFHFRIEKARASFEEQQSFIRTQAQQHARDVGQPLPNLMHKRFPTPTRVDRKPNKRFLAMLDAARKLARKRETALNKQEKSQQADAQAQRPPAPPSTGNAHTPQYFSRLKYEREVKDMERMREQQRAVLMEQQRRQAGYQAALTNGIGQQMRNGMANGQVGANGHLVVPSHNQLRPQQHPGMHAGLPNGMPSNAQLAAGVRAQVNMQNQQRLVPHANGQGAANQENIARLMQQQQQQQQQRLQQLNRGSPNAANAVPNLNMLSTYNGNNQFASSSDGVQSPNMSQQPQNNAVSQQSPHVAQALAAAVGASQPLQVVGGQNAPQALSSGHVPHFMTLQHQIHKSNPSMSSQEARVQATEQLKFLMRQNAINAASGMANAGQPNSGGGNGGVSETGGGSQSPYANAAQMQSPFQQNGILASNHGQHQGQGRGQSPNAAQQQQHNQYQAQLRQQMYNQQQRQQQMGGGPAASGADNSGASLSPGLAQALPSNLGLGNMGIGVPMMGGYTGGNSGSTRTPTPGGSLRPPSRDMNALGAARQAGEQQRPGSATGMAHSPHTMSAQGFTGQG